MLTLTGGLFHSKTTQPPIWKVHTPIVYTVALGVLKSSCVSKTNRSTRSRSALQAGLPGECGFKFITIPLCQDDVLQHIHGHPVKPRGHFPVTTIEKRKRYALCTTVNYQIRTYITLPYISCRHRFAFHDYNRLAAEDERDVGDSTDIDGSDDWIVTDDDEGDDDVLGRLGQDGISTAEAPF